MFSKKNKTVAQGRRGCSRFEKKSTEKYLRTRGANTPSPSAGIDTPPGVRVFWGQGAWPAEDLWLKNSSLSHLQSKWNRTCFYGPTATEGVVLPRLGRGGGGCHPPPLPQHRRPRRPARPRLVTTAHAPPHRHSLPHTQAHTAHTPHTPRYCHATPLHAPASATPVPYSCLSPLAPVLLALRMLAHPLLRPGTALPHTPPCTQTGVTSTSSGNGHCINKCYYISPVQQIPNLLA